MAKKGKDARVNIQVECTDCRKSGEPGVYRYSTEKNRRNTTQRLELNKYCPVERKVTLFREVR